MLQTPKDSCFSVFALDKPTDAVYDYLLCGWRGMLIIVGISVCQANVLLIVVESNTTTITPISKAVHQNNLVIYKKRGTEMNDEVPLADCGQDHSTPADLAMRYFKILNGMSAQEWFVDSASREAFVVEYVGFIEKRGSVAFQWFADRQVAANNAWSNNIAFRECLRREIASSVAAQAAAIQRLDDFEWLHGSRQRSQILHTARRCTRPEWVVAKAEFIDALAISETQKAEQFGEALEAEAVDNA